MIISAYGGNPNLGTVQNLSQTATDLGTKLHIWDLQNTASSLMIKFKYENIK
jgi:hypothetical protein